MIDDKLTAKAKIYGINIKDGVYSFPKGLKLIYWINSQYKIIDVVSKKIVGYYDENFGITNLR